MSTVDLNTLCCEKILNIVNKEDDLNDFFHWLANSDYHHDSDETISTEIQPSHKRSFQEMIVGNPVMMSDDVDLEVKPKSRRAWRRAHPIPRMLKRDTRRTFPMMITNVLNSGDNDILGRFFTSHCVHSCHLSSLNKGNACGRESSKLRVHGVDFIISMIMTLLDATPDFVIQLNESYIKQYLDKAGCQVIVTSHVQGTRIRDFLKAMAEANPKFIVLSNDLDGFVKDNSADKSSNSCQDIMTEYTLDLIVRTNYWLDNNNRIYLIESECDNYKMMKEGSCNSGSTAVE